MPLGIPDTATATGDIVYELSLGGQPFAAQTGLKSIVVERSVNRIASAQIILMDDDSGDTAYPLSNEDFTKPGSEVEIKAGYGDQSETIFKGLVVSQRLKIDRRKSVLFLECKNNAVKMSLIKNSAYYYQQKDSDVFSLLISNAGSQPDVEDSTVTNNEMVQYSCSDWDFMVSRAEANGMFVITTDDAVKVMKPPATGTAAVTATYGSNIFEFDAGMDARTQLKEIKSITWDTAAQAIADETSTEPSFPSNGNMTGEDLADCLGGATYEVKHSGKIETSELKAWADAKLVKSRLAKMRGRVKINGTSGAVPGELIELQGLGDRFNGTAVITAVRQEIASGNWLTDIQFGLSPKWFTEEDEVSEMPAAALLPAIQGLQIGVVTALENDPDGECRIKVKVPVISTSDDGIWARQATTDAGNNRGWVIHPEIGDEVIVGFINNDPRDPVVLGALHSSANTAPVNAQDANNEKGWITRSGIKIMVDDKKKCIEISTPAGKKLVMDEDAKTITIADENNNKIEMSSSGINIESGKDITLKATGDIKAEGINIEAKATAALKAEGSASAEVKSSGNTTIKGGIVMIN